MTAPGNHSSTQRVKPWFVAGLLLVASHCQQPSKSGSRASPIAESNETQHEPDQAEPRRTQRRRERSGAADEAVARSVPALRDVELPWLEIRLGDGWGCALRQDHSYACWTAAPSASSGPELVARSVPWLDGKRIFVGPDRICTPEGTRLRCWRAPEFIQARESSFASPASTVQSWVIPLESTPEGAFLHDPTPVTHGVRTGCAAGYCWGAASAFAPTSSCQFGSIWLPCAAADEPMLRELARSDGLKDIELGLSERPSACGTDERRRLSCWGAGYSRDAAGVVPVRVRSSPAQPFVAWDAPGHFHRSCAIRSNCGRSAHPLPSCAPNSKSLAPAEVLALADGLEGARVSVRGNLVLTPVVWRDLSGIACGPFTTNGKPSPIEALGGGSGAFCCPARGDAPVRVTNGHENLILDGSWCFGDSSRTCCSLPVFGQAVIASGVLAWREASPEWSEGWVLQQADVCEAEPPR